MPVWQCQQKSPFRLRLSQHQLAHDLPVGTEAQTSTPSFLNVRCVVLAQDLRTHETVIELHDQRFHVVFCHQVIQRIGAVLAAAERDDAVVGVLAAVRLDQRGELVLAGRCQSIASLLELVLRQTLHTPCSSNMMVSCVSGIRQRVQRRNSVIGSSSPSYRSATTGTSERGPARDVAEARRVEYFVQVAGMQTVAGPNRPHVTRR